MGARGNSGVITSDCSVDLVKVSRDKTELDGQDLAHAFQTGVEVAYKAVMKPVEGTIALQYHVVQLQQRLKLNLQMMLLRLCDAALDGAKAALAKTPEMLPVLKEVGVVDSGGQVWSSFMEGFLSALTGEYIASEDFKRHQLR